MKFILQFFGYGWALMGIANIAMSPFWAVSVTEDTSFAIVGLLMFNMLLFILPGLAVGGIGSNKNKEASK